MDKRNKIIASRAFRTWWSARRNISPIPSDPYRAYMIDLELKAMILPEEYWRFRTNRADVPEYDYPIGIPIDRRRTPSRKHLKKRWKLKPKPAQPLVMTPYEKALVGMVRKAEERFHLPATEIRIEPREKAAYTPQILGKAIITMPKGYVAQAAKQQIVKEQVEATMLHEFGHHAHAAYAGFTKAMSRQIQEKGALSSILKGVPFQPFAGTMETRIGAERVAWKVAKKVSVAERKRWHPISAWRKKYALGTYIRAAPQYALEAGG